MKGIEIIELEAYRDERGWNTHPLDETELSGGEYNNVHLVSMQPGAIRGNHKHFKQVERVIAIGNNCLLAAIDPDTGEKFEQVFDESRLFRVIISPGVPHAFKNIGQGVTYLLCASDVAYDPDAPDSEYVKVLD